MGITRKKPFTYSEKPEAERGTFLREPEEIPVENQVYEGEWGIHRDLKREYGRAAARVKTEYTKRGRKFRRVNVVASTVKDGNGYQKRAAECYQGSMNAERFERWFEQCLLISPFKSEARKREGIKKASPEAVE